MNPTIASGASRALDTADRAVRIVVMVSMAAMVVVVSAQVLLRYAFNTSLDWGEDIARMLFVWAIFLAIPLGIREGAHIGIELVVRKFPVLGQRLLTRVMAILAIGLMAVICWQAAILIVDQWDENLPTLSVPTSLFMVPVCIGAALSVLHLLRLAIAGDAPRAAESAE